jgi:hypothetical protein
MDEVRRALVRRLNDRLRRQHQGGRIVITSGVQALGPAFLEAALAAVASFERFDADNDPHGEHDFGALTVEGRRVLFKVDYYDSTLTAGSPDPADPAVTTRVLTIMLAEEY